MRRLAARAEALCRAVAPDLAGGPLYVALVRDLPSELRWPERLEGLTTRYLDLTLRPTLERFGRWRGRGPAMILSPQAIAADLAELGRPARRRCFMPVFLGDALHELAHILDAGLMGGPEPPAGLVAFAALVLKAELDGVTAPTDGPGSTVPWRRHEAPFIRLAVHLAHRARACGVWLQSTDVFDAAEYGLSPTYRYSLALGDEPARLAGSPLADVQATPPPAAFVELWQADVQRWKAEQAASPELSKAPAACERRIPIQEGDEVHVDRVVERVGNTEEEPGGQLLGGGPEAGGRREGRPGYGRTPAGRLRPKAGGIPPRSSPR